jgi:hypothetical protein
MNLQTFTRGMLLALVALALVVAPPPATSKTGEKQKQGTEKKDDAKKGRSTLRVPRQAYEVIKNKVSNIEVFSSNYGIFGLNVERGQAGGTWPRGSSQAYIFGGGVWFGAQKVRGNDTNKLCVIGYNPNSGASWMVPGVINGPLAKSGVDETPDAINKYRLYFSSDYNTFDGRPFDKTDVTQGGPNWPMWDTNPTDTLRHDRYFGTYLDDISLRNLEHFPKGPAIITGEDIVSIYKDTDLGRYERISRDTALKKGYPIGIQVEQAVYSWGFGKYGDFLFIRYAIINKSGEDLLNCYMAPAIDMDIGNAGNDHNSIVIPNKDEDSLNLAVQWSEGESSTKPYGYVGLDFLESPAIDSLTGYIRKDKRVFTEKEQVGLSVFRGWPIEDDPTSAEARYEFMSDRTHRDIDNGPGDRRFLMATGPFNMRPGDTARVVIGIMFAYGKAKVATGLPADMGNIIALDTFAQKVYDENFLAPVPPDPANVTWGGINNGVELHWDERSERSVDRQERGLDFAGYTIKRARRTVGFPSADSTDGWNLGFKTIGGFKIPEIPDSLQRFIAARQNKLSALGPWWRLPMLLDTNKPGILRGSRGDSVVIHYRYDTLKRPGLGDQIIRGDAIDTVPVFSFAFDPYDDASDSLTRFNNRTFPGFPDSTFKDKTIRDIVRNAITAIMDSLTDGRRFVDVGDDNNDGRIEENGVDLSQNEKLINNVDYYYQVLAFDAGSDEGTPAKSNSGIAGINEVRATPESPAAGPIVNPKVIPGEGLGGIHNFRFITLDNQRLGQLFGGDTLDFTFDPALPTEFLSDSLQAAGQFIPEYFYTSKVTVRSEKRNKELLRFALNYGEFTDRSDDTIKLLDSNLTSRRTGTTRYNARNVMVPYNLSYTADPLRPVYNTVGIYKNTFAIGFDYSFIQFGDTLRPGVFGDTTFKQSPFSLVTTQGTNTNLSADRVLYVGQWANIARSLLSQRIPSIGQPKLEISFEPGGSEDLRLTKNGKNYTFKADYLNVRVRNIASYKRQVYDAAGNLTEDSVVYNYEFPSDPEAKIKADTTSSALHVERVIDRGKFALYAFAWLNPDALDDVKKKAQFARAGSFVGVPNDAKYYVGTPNRYYMGSYKGDDTTTVKFTHKLIVNGDIVYLDYAGMGSSASQVDPASIPNPAPSSDFKAGDKVIVQFTGGTLGLPQPGATVRVVIPEVKPALDSYTDDQLDQVNIVPNPYLVNHIGQSSNNDRKLYFTRLPDKCTIELFTESGELLQTLNHDATNGSENGREAVEVWDLLTASNRQTQSQLIVVRITTPNGAETVKKVAIVVGGFRLNNR